MASRKNPHGGYYSGGGPPSVNLFSSIDDETSDPILPNRDAAEQERLARDASSKQRSKQHNPRAENGESKMELEAAGFR